MKKTVLLSVLLCFMLLAGISWAADTVPTEIMMPGTQPEEANLESPNRCLNCHSGYATDPRTEPGFGWLGSAMGNAGRDPIFWATLAIAEQDFDGAGDLCIRCHSSGGWMGGRSTPTDGSGLAASDEDGIDCDTCHQMSNPDMSEHIGLMFDPFIANQGDSLTPAQAGEGYYGSGMYVLANDYGKLGPYAEGDAVARHQFTQSRFHRDPDFCGTCHDVSNSAVGDLAPNAGAQPGAPDVINSYDFPPLGQPNLGGPVEEKAAFNNPPYAYGVVERTFSEYKSSPLSSLLVDNFASLPADLQDPRGSLYNAYMAATNNNRGTANYADGTSPRYFSCQTCHVRAVTGQGADKANVPVRDDLPMHDMTGGNYWVYPLVQYQDQQGTLRLGGGLDAAQIAAMDDGMLRAGQHLTQAGTLDVNGNTVKVTNMTGHKLISGYPEGRRMWLNIKWYDATGVKIREDGEYGDLPTTVVNPKDGTTFVPRSLLDLHDPNTKIYEVHPAISQEWAQILVTALPHTDTPVGFDRLTGTVTKTLGELAAQPAGTYEKSFHFVLNNYIAEDNRIPPYQMSYDEARKRNALPVPDTQYGGNGPGSVYNYWDDVALNPPTGAVSADITLYYQGTSWEYVQFLWKANTTPAGAFLADEGVNFLDAWVKTGMVEPYVMATTTWGQTGCNVTEDPETTLCFDGLDNDCDETTDCADTSCDGAVGPATQCGLGVCAATGNLTCSGGAEADTCTPGAPTEPGMEVSCGDGLDNDCDGLTDMADPDCAGPMACGDYPDKNSCNMDPNCEWDRKAGMCIDVPPPVDCSQFADRNSCRDAGCSWDNKAGICM